MTTIVLDAMGGDYAPEAVIEGLLLALPQMRSRVILIGRMADMQRCLKGTVPDRVELLDAPEVVDMDEKPMEALRKKKNSSLVMGIDLVKQGRAEAFVSAGSTGACTAGSLLSWRQITGIRRPAIGSAMPNKHGRFLLLDAGASPDVDPEDLIQFAIMGRAYMSSVMGRKNPTVHLMNIGEEPGKGNAFSKAAYECLSGFSWFRGNMETKDVFKSQVDVAVCDAFVGNMILKTAEGVAEYMSSMIKEQLPTNPLLKLPYLPLRKVMAPIRKQMDYAEIGGSPLLGLNGVCIICHGRSNPKAMMNALLQAESAIEHNLQDAIRAGLTEAFPTSAVVG
ncbi:MAG: phosphate acyltransferase PlsX [Chthonomonas sp.]|nr:phosphate acyltransferase PlsX [Chthonomonas sp.]